MKNLADIHNFQEIQEELAHVTAEIERQGAEVIRAREARDIMVGIYDRKYDEAYIARKAASSKDSAETLCRIARAEVAEDRVTADQSEREWKAHLLRMEVLERRLRAIEILSNNMRAELKNLRGVPA